MWLSMSCSVYISAHTDVMTSVAEGYRAPLECEACVKQNINITTLLSVQSVMFRSSLFFLLHIITLIPTPRTLRCQSSVCFMTVPGEDGKIGWTRLNTMKVTMLALCHCGVGIRLYASCIYSIYTVKTTQCLKLWSLLQLREKQKNKNKKKSLL